MALRDYICCSKCHAKLIYDGYGSIRDNIERIWGEPDGDEWTHKALCPQCSSDGDIHIKVKYVEGAP